VSVTETGTSSTSDSRVERDKGSEYVSASEGAFWIAEYESVLASAGRAEKISDDRYYRTLDMGQRRCALRQEL
jgi:hypothetical protein